MEHGALDDTPGMHRIRTMAKRVVEISQKRKSAVSRVAGFLSGMGNKAGKPEHK
jgi:hypothetical protein